MRSDVFGARASLETRGGTVAIYRLSALERAGLVRDLARLPFSIRVLLEAVLRHVDGELVSEDDVRNLAGWDAARPRDVALPYLPPPVILPAFTDAPPPGH